MTTPITEPKIMWKHYCKSEKAWIGVGKGQACNWCDCLDQSK